MHQPFTVHKRPTTKQKKNIYYVQYRDRHGRRMSTVSSGKTTKAEAIDWAEEHLLEQTKFRGGFLVQS